MLKKEILYREILAQFLERRAAAFTQLALSKKFGFSLSTVHNALKPLVSMGAVNAKRRGFELADAKKALLYWATVRSLQRDILYATRMEVPVSESEKMAPSAATYTAYTAYRLKFNDTPADYSELYFYIPESELGEVKKRFPERKGPPNIIVLRADPFLKPGIVPLPQLFVDLWNLKTWYAKDFVHALEAKL
ncbi:MAG TPA: hypothetical protein VJH24_00130 [Candidatus Bilamarchaeaceae archaeon]|nr:hypothetical protein [Candidatus Bilamarchaeaceae archaeon]